MNFRFKYKKSVNVSYKRQGYIYFVSQAYATLPAEKKKKIRELCQSAGKQYADAIFEFVTTDRTATAICMDHYIGSQKTLYEAVRRYYESFPKYL